MDDRVWVYCIFGSGGHGIPRRPAKANREDLRLPSRLWSPKDSRPHFSTVIEPG